MGYDARCQPDRPQRSHPPTPQWVRVSVSRRPNLITAPTHSTPAKRHGWSDPAFDERVVPLVELIYAAATHPERWNGFITALSRDLGGAAIVMNMEIPNRIEPAAVYRIHSEAHYGEVFAELATRGKLPWPLAEMAKLERFVRSDEYLSSAELENTEVYRRYMKPQGFVSEGQGGHVFAAIDRRPLAAIGIYCREGGRQTTRSDFAMLDRLVPHLRRAYAIHCELREAHYRHQVTTEVIDRFPVGVLLVDRDLNVVESNRAADRIAAQHDGFSIVDGVPRATGFVSSAGSSGLLAGSVSAEAGAAVTGNIFSIERPSGRQPYEALVAALLGAPQVTGARQPVAVVFIADPEDQHLRMPQVLATLYNLTRAELDLASLLSSGHSVEEAARARNVSENTVRSQLKKIFAKTGVNRQTDLVRLLTASVAALETPSDDGG